MRLLLTLAFVLVAAALPQPANAAAPDRERIILAQNGGKTLSQAIEQVRRDTGGRILSAETKVQNGREVHHIKVLIKDSQVKTNKIPGRTVGG